MAGKLSLEIAGSLLTRGGARATLLRGLRLAGYAAIAAAVTGALLSIVAERDLQSATEGRLYADAAALPEGSPRVAIVPGARVFSDGTPSHALGDRLYTALALHEAGLVDKILLSGDHAATAYDEVNAMHAWMLARGVDADALYLDHAGLRTLDTMARAAEVFQIERAVICTQRFHLARSVYLARAFGIDAVGVAADRRVLRSRYWNEGRERLARVRAWLDVHVLKTKPRFLGPPLPIDGPAAATHDRRTAPAPG